MYKKIACFILFLFVCATAYAKTINIVAAENFYGDIAKQIGGRYVSVTSIINSPVQDPHLFSSSPATAEAIAKADLVIYNGIDYDSWMSNLLQADPIASSKIIVVANLLGKKSGDNPHIWYNPTAMWLCASQITKELTALDPQNKSYYEERLAVFKQKYNALNQTILNLKQLYDGTPVIATEPVFGSMANALGFKMYGDGFQLSVMNETEPSVKDTADFENKLTKHQVKILIYNGQVTDPVTDRMKALASNAGIPIVGVSETEPLSQDYWTWMNSELKGIKTALMK